MANNTSVTRTYDRIFSIVRDTVGPILFDNISVQTSFLYALKMLDGIKPVPGKAHFRFNILKELPDTVGYQDLDPLTPSRGDPVTSAVYEWKQLATPIQLSGRDMIKTDGDDAVVDLLELFIQAAEISHREAIGGSTLGIFSDGNETDLDKISGLQTILSTTPTVGSVGNISRASLTAWRHQSQNVSSAFDTNGLNRIRTLFRQCKRHNETPNLIVVNGSTLDNFERELTSTFEVHLPFNVGAGNQSMIDAGFANINYKGALMFDDDGVPANVGYFINTKYLKLYVHESRNAEIGDIVKSQDKDDIVSYVYSALALCATNLARMGVLLNSDTY